MGRGLAEVNTRLYLDGAQCGTESKRSGRDSSIRVVIVNVCIAVAAFRVRRLRGVQSSSSGQLRDWCWSSETRWCVTFALTCQGGSLLRNGCTAVEGVDFILRQRTVFLFCRKRIAFPALKEQKKMHDSG